MNETQQPSTIFLRNRLLLLFAITLISRLPLLSAGYGVEEDSWGMVNALQRMASTGVYETSRFPGHPVVEAVYYLMLNCNAFWCNMITALLSAGASVFFALILFQSGIKNYFSAALAFAFIPVVYINSGNNMDYLWAVCFIIMSWWLLINNRLLLAGMFLGLATGCRLSSIITLISFCILLSGFSFSKKNMLRVFPFVFAAAITSVLVFAPLIKHYGLTFLTHPETLGYPQLAKVAYKASIGAFGLIGFIGTSYFVLKAFTTSNQTIIQNNNYKWFVLSAIALSVLLYFYLPQKSAFLIPALPFFIFYLTHYLTSKQINALALMMMCSCFFAGINLEDAYRGVNASALSKSFTIFSQPVTFDLLQGPVQADYLKREQKIDFVKKVIKETESFKQPALIIAGWWINEIEVTAKHNINKNVKLVYFASEQELMDAEKKHCAIYYLPQQNTVNDERFEKKFTNDYAMPLFDDDEASYVY